MTDKNGVKLSNGMYVRYRKDPRNPNSLPENLPEDFEGWVFWIMFDGVRYLGLFTNDSDNNIRFTGLYFEDDGEPCYELTVDRGIGVSNG